MEQMMMRRYRGKGEGFGHPRLGEMSLLSAIMAVNTA